MRTDTDELLSRNRLALLPWVGRVPGPGLWLHLQMGLNRLGYKERRGAESQAELGQRLRRGNETRLVNSEEEPGTLAWSGRAALA